MTININGRTILRLAAATAATIGVGAAAFFGGQTTRMSDEAIASQKSTAVETAVKQADDQHAADIAELEQAAKTEQRTAVKQAVKRTVKMERNRAEQLAETARDEGYASGNSVGYSAGNAAGHEAGVEEGVEEGIETASDELICSDDLDVDLPACTW